MSEDTIGLLLAGEYEDPDGGARLAVPTRDVVIAVRLDGSEAELVTALELGRKFAVVSDQRTHEILGARIERAIASLGSVESIVLEGYPSADLETVEKVRIATERVDALVAVGSGTINDLCKFTAAQDGKSYVVFATAPSMNGYTAVNAAITVHGHKQSLPAVAPVGVFLDLEILAAAPIRMIRSGLGDSLCRSTAQADWLMSHLVLGTDYREAPFVLLEGDEEGLMAEPEALVAGDLEAVARLARTLVLSGFGLTICGSSAPGSQGEHLISHYMDMMAPPDRPQVFHGEQVGAATLVMARLQERILGDDAPRLRPTRRDKAQVISHFGGERGELCWSEFVHKINDTGSVERLNDLLAENWAEIRRRLASVTRAPAQLEDVLRRAGAPVSCDRIHVSRPFFSDAVRHAREIRNRFTFLDLAADSGVLDPDALIGEP